MRVMHRLLPAILITILLLGAMLAGHADAETNGKKEAGQAALVQTDFSRLEGKWIRPDGGYILELKGIRSDGSMTAAYFNPRPIRVFRAEASKKEGKITLLVELRDVNYPGSTYRLQYDAATDRLLGTYFQAVERQTFNVQFLRAR